MIEFVQMNHDNLYFVCVQKKNMWDTFCNFLESTNIAEGWREGLIWADFFCLFVFGKVLLQCTYAEQTMSVLLDFDLQTITFRNMTATHHLLFEYQYI